MAQILSLGLATKIVLVGVWAALTFALVLVLIHRGNEVATVRIVIVLNDDLQKLGLRFWLLHVRDGKDEIKDAGPLLNEEIAFKSLDRHGTMEATVTYSKRIGFQFKCFVEQVDYPYERVEQLLKESDFSEPSKGVGPKYRIFFILKEYPTYKTIDGFVNNFYYPS